MWGRSKNSVPGKAGPGSDVYVHKKTLVKIGDKRLKKYDFPVSDYQGSLLYQFCFFMRKKKCFMQYAFSDDG